jgi:hypothetical protein
VPTLKLPPGAKLVDLEPPTSDIQEVPGDVRTLVASAAKKYGVNPDELSRIAQTESSFNPRAVGPVTRTGERAKGVMQLMPGTAKEMGVTDPFNPQQNVEAGAKYYASLVRHYNGDTEKARAAYNFGVGNVDKGKAYPKETQDYLKKTGDTAVTAKAEAPAATGLRLPPGAKLVDLPAQEQPPPQTAAQTAMDMGRTVAGFGGDVFSGIGGQAMTSLKGLAKLAERGARMGMPGGPIETFLENSPTVQKLTEDRSGVAEKIGRFTGSMLEAAIPGPAEAKLATKINEVLPWGLRLLARAGLSGATGATMGAIQSGGDAQAGLEAGKVAAGTTLFLGMLAAPLRNWGRRIQLSNIKPRAVDVKDGFKAETLDKIGLKGNLEQSFNQVEKKLNELRTARNNLLKPGSANVDLGKAFDETLAEVEKRAKELHFGEAGDTALAEVKKIREGVQNMLHPPQAPSGLLNAQGKPIPMPQPSLNAVDIRKVENLKEFMGMTGSWAYGRGDRDANVKELVANTLYSKLRAAIEQSLGPQGAEVKALNRQMQDLIPVKHAMMARIPVEQRNQVFSLTDIAAMIPAIVTGDVRMLALEGLTRGQKNIRYGNLARRAFPQGAGRYAGGVARQANPWIVPPLP